MTQTMTSLAVQTTCYENDDDGYVLLDVKGGESLSEIVCLLGRFEPQNQQETLLITHLK